MVTESVENLAGNAGKMLDFVNQDVLNDYKGMVESGETYNEDAVQMNEMMQDLQSVAENLRRLQMKFRRLQMAYPSSEPERSGRV